MPIQLYNSRTKSVDPLQPINSGSVAIYSCGPTVYDTVHIGNLSSFIIADILRRVMSVNNLETTHVMNFTDIDDKTIRRSRELYPTVDAMMALKKLTTEYGDVFLRDMRTIGNDVDALSFIKAADDTTIEGMRELIEDLVHGDFAYVADDGVYFSIDAYKKSGKTYGQLVTLSEATTSTERIQNDEYDKDSAHDFALWKTRKPGEPAWPLTLDGVDLTGRPGWHIECSVMSRMKLGQPFDIHTGGIDLAFPHHENEIAQSTAGRDDPTYASVFVHNEHILIDGKKMSKSLRNFYTLTDLTKQGIDPLAFRLLVLQSHYRKSTNFSFTNAQAAQSRLNHWRAVAALRHQTHDTLRDDGEKSTDQRAVSLLATSQAIIEALSNDLGTPEALTIIDDAFSRLDGKALHDIHQFALVQLLETIDQALGLQLMSSTPDISDDAKQLIVQRQRARDDKEWTASDQLRDQLLVQGIVVRDTPGGSIWEYARA